MILVCIVVVVSEAELEPIVSRYVPGDEVKVNTPLAFVVATCVEAAPVVYAASEILTPASGVFAA